MDFLSKQGGRGEKEDEGGEGEKGEDHADEEGEEREMEWRATLTRQGGDYQARLVCEMRQARNVLQAAQVRHVRDACRMHLLRQCTSQYTSGNIAIPPRPLTKALAT